MKAVRNDSGPAREEFREPSIVRAENQRLLRLLREVRELAANGVQVRVEVEVLGIDVQHDGMLRTKFGECAIALVRFSNKIFLRSDRREASVSRELWHESADGVARVCTKFLKSESKQGRGRGLAMHPGDADAALAIDQRREQDRAANDGDLPLLGSFQFRVVEPDGRGIDDQRGPRGDELFRVVANVNCRAAFLKLACLVASDEVRTGHAPAKVEQEMREPAHAAAADADEVGRRTGGGGGQERADLVCGERNHLE